MEETTLEWPRISADETKLARQLKEMGYQLEHRGNSGFESRNSYKIFLEDRELNQELLAQINRDIEKGKENVAAANLQSVAEEFARRTVDSNGIFGYITLGGHFENPQDYDHQKFAKIAGWRSANTADHRRGFGHTYTYMLYDKAKLEQSNIKYFELTTAATDSLNGLCALSREKGLSFKIGSGETAQYITDGRKLDHASGQDFDLADSAEREKALTLDALEWPKIRGDHEDLAQKMKNLGYVLEYQGRSGFAVRNAIYVKTPDGKISEEILTQMREELKREKENLTLEKQAVFDRAFDEQSPDPQKTYCFLNTGGDWEKSRLVNSEKYESIASEIVSYTGDSRRGLTHTYGELFINIERMQKDPRRMITLEVPKLLMGKIIGRGGSNIKALGEKYSKFLKVVQDPNEVSRDTAKEIYKTFENKLYGNGEAEALNNLDLTFKDVAGLKDADREKLQQQIQQSLESQRAYLAQEAQEAHQAEVNKLKRAIAETIPDLKALNNQQIAKRMEKFLETNKENFTFIPKIEDLVQIQENLQYQRNILREKEAADNRIKIHEMDNEIQDGITLIEREKRNDGAEIGQDIITKEELEKLVTERYKDDPLAAKFTDSFIEGFAYDIETRQQQAAAKINAMKQFETVTDQELARFYSNDAGSHEDGFFSAVGKDRRRRGYETITERVAKRLGLINSDDKDNWSSVEWKDYGNLLKKVIDHQQKRSEESREFEYQPEISEDAFNQAFEEASESLPETAAPTETTEERKAKLKAAKKAVKSGKPETTVTGLDGLAALKAKFGGNSGK